MTFAETLIAWYEEHGRRLPWRETRDAYRIWLSEIILQQTRIEQGLSYYEHFTLRYPTVEVLAAASEEAVLKSWQGLGYYSRARNLHKAARQIVEQYGGRFPETYEGIRSLSGVGRYTAAAIASFVFRLPYPVIDGNVYRLTARCFGIDTPIGTSQAYSEFEQLLMRLIDRRRPDLFNQAMMDFGSTYCKPLAARGTAVTCLPGCSTCVLADRCVAYREGKVTLLPVKGAAKAVCQRYFYYLDIRWQEGGSMRMWMQRRQKNDIWKWLYEVPLIETAHPLEPTGIEEKLKQRVEAIGGVDVAKIECRKSVTHKLTHQHIVAVYTRITLGKPPLHQPENIITTTPEEAAKMPVSRLMERLLSAR